MLRSAAGRGLIRGGEGLLGAAERAAAAEGRACGGSRWLGVRA